MFSFASCRSIKKGNYIENHFFDKSNDGRDQTKGCFIETKEGNIIESPKITYDDIKVNHIDVDGIRYDLQKLKTIQTTTSYYAYCDQYSWLKRTYKGRMDIYMQSFSSSSVQINSITNMTTTSIPVNVKLPIVKNPNTNEFNYAYNYKFVSPLINDEKLCAPYLKKYIQKERIRKINRYSNYIIIVLDTVGLSIYDPESSETESQKNARKTPFAISG